MKPYYEHGGITIYHGDCREVLPTLEPVHLVLTSPPYNLSEGNAKRGGLRVGHVGSKWQRDDLRQGYGTHADRMPYPEYIEWQRGIVRQCWNLLDDFGAIFYNHKPRVQDGLLRTPLPIVEDLPLRQIIIWDRGGGFNYMSGAYVPVHEWLLLIAKPSFQLRDKAASGVGDVWRISPEIDTPHPAPFPLQLADTVMQTTTNGTVLDPFCGSGTTLVAAKFYDQDAIGIEIEERYCEIAASRLSQEVLDLGGVA